MPLSKQVPPLFPKSAPFWFSAQQLSHVKLFVYYFIVCESHQSISCGKSGLHLFLLSLGSPLVTQCSAYVGFIIICGKYQFISYHSIFISTYSLWFFFFLLLLNRGNIFLCPIEDASSLNLVDSAVAFLLFLGLLFSWIIKMNSLSYFLQLFTISSPLWGSYPPYLLILERGGICIQLVSVKREQADCVWSHLLVCSLIL